MGNFLGFRLGVVQRSRRQRSVVRSTYQRGGAVRLSDGSVIDHSGRDDHIAHFMLAPEGAPAWTTDCEQLWTRATAAERRADAQEARLIEISFPRALTRTDWIELAHRLGRLLVRHGMVVQIDIHCPLACDGLPNPHAHVMATMREIDNNGFARLKARHWNKLFYGQARALRRDWAGILNQYCRQHGVDYNVDHRSNAERGLLPAEIRLPRWNVARYKRTGQKTAAMEKRDQERAAKAEIARLEAECRKIELDLAVADAEPPPSTDASSAMPVQQPSLLPTGSAMLVRNRDVRAEDLSALPMYPNLTDRELPGARYGP